MSKTPRTDEAMFATAMNRTVVVHVRFAQQLETELADKDRQLAEARAEIERLSSRDGNAKHELVYDDGDNPFAREKLEHIDFGVCDNQYVLESHLLNNTVEKVRAKDKLIEQMREALASADNLIDEYAADYEHRDNVDEIREEIKAALAAERGEWCLTR